MAARPHDLTHVLGCEWRVLILLKAGPLMKGVADQGDYVARYQGRDRAQARGWIDADNRLTEAGWAELERIGHG